ncbi:MAG: YigZ family protein [Paludibacteraceae bacterium]|nr:YigZ family protein [Paludibacteraceae bacterium]
MPKTDPHILSQGIYKDRGSRFLGFVERIADEEAAKERIAWYKKSYHDARHVCYAYRLGADLWRTKDDGEPHGTAGLPILRSIDAAITAGKWQVEQGILVVVVRYFGGTLLGTGGLMVAYREAAKDALAQLPENV